MESMDHQISQLLTNQRDTKLITLLLTSGEMNQEQVRNAGFTQFISEEAYNRFLEGNFFNNKIHLQNGQNIIDESALKESCLIILINRLLELMSKQTTPGLAEQIISRCSIDSVQHLPLFSDILFKRKFKNILYNCRSFKSWRIHNGRDIKYQQSKIKAQIQSILLLRLNLNKQKAEDLCKKIINNPLQNIIASDQDLTNKQKTHFYQSYFKLQKMFKNYSEILYYENSLSYKSKCEMCQIFQKLQQNHIGLSKEIVSHVINYELHRLLGVDTIRNSKQIIYEFVQKKAKNYYRCFEKIYSQQRENIFNPEKKKIIQQFSRNQMIDLSLKIKNLFLKIKLPFQDWQVTEQQMKSQDIIKTQKLFSLISKLQLSSLSKTIFYNQFFQTIEPVFRKIKKPLSNRISMELYLFGKIISIDKQFGYPIDKILSFAIKSSSPILISIRTFQLEQVSLTYKALYNEKVEKDPLFIEYMKSNGINKEQVYYQNKKDLRKKIVQVFKQHQLQILRSLEDLSQSLLQKKNKFPQNIKQFLKILQQKLPDYKQTIRLLLLSIDNPEGNNLIINEFQKLFSDVTNQICQKYSWSVRDSMFVQILRRFYNGNRVRYLKDIIEKKAFSDEKSQFYQRPRRSQILFKKAKWQFKANYQFISDELKTADDILKIIKSIKQNGIKSIMSKLIQTLGDQNLISFIRRKIFSS